MSDRVSVPCGACRACCRSDAVFLHPEMGDDPTLYQTVKTTHPLTGQSAHMLAHKKNGECVYLGEGGCTIHDRAPAICREFDCRRMYLQTPRIDRKRMIREGVFSKAVFDAGRDRLETLP